MKELAKFKIDMFSERGEPRLSFEYKFVGHPWKLLKLYPTVDSYFFFYCLPLSFWGVRSTRRHFKYCSKLICFSERGELGFEYFNFKIIPNRTCISVFLNTVLYCFHWEHRQVEGVRSAHGVSLRYEGIGRIQNWYVILKGENLGFHLNINLSATLENF